MAKTKEVDNSPENESEGEQYLTYTINVYDGGTFNINISDTGEVRIMSGQPSQPPPKPPHG